MSLTKTDLQAIKGLIDASIDERVPKIIDERVPAIIDRRVQPMLDKLEDRLEGRFTQKFEGLDQKFTGLTQKFAGLTQRLDQLTLDVGRFSLETTNNFAALNGRIDELGAKLVVTTEMAYSSHVEVAKLKRKLHLT